MTCGSKKWDRTTDLGLMSPAPSPFSTFLYYYLSQQIVSGPKISLSLIAAKK